MVDLSVLDTPITRATILDMTEEQLTAHVESMRERRMRSYTLYQEAQLLKAEKKHAEDAERLEKVISMMTKAFVACDNALEKLTKYGNEIRVLKLALEE